MPLKGMVRIASIVLVLMLFVQSQTVACPVCYGEKGSSETDGLNWAIMFLLGVTGTVLSAVGAFFLRLRKRSKMTLSGDADLPSVN